VYLDNDESVFAFSSWSTFSRYSDEAVEAEILSAIESETYQCFGQDHITLEDLEKLSPLCLSDEGVRGVYFAIGRGPDGEIALYIGSTHDLLVRIAFHNLAISQKSKVLDVYRTLSQEGWTFEWKILARFPANVHQCNSYMLESVMILVAQSLDPTSNSPWHPKGVRDWLEPLFEETCYTFSPVQLNHCLPFKQGFSLRDDRVKVCVGCSVRSDSENASPFNRDWYQKDPLHPFASYECPNCYRVRYQSGKDRAAIEQKLLDSKQIAQQKRHVSGYGKLPSRCDWCGKSAKRVGLNVKLALCLCKSDNDRAKRMGIPKPPEPNVQPESGRCDLCQTQSARFTFLPYPAAKFVCNSCLPGCGEQIQDLARKQHSLNDSFKVNPDQHPFMILLDEILEDECSLDIPAKLLGREPAKKVTRKRKAQPLDEAPEAEFDGADEASNSAAPSEPVVLKGVKGSSGHIIAQPGHDDRVRSQGDARKAAREWRGLERRIDVPIQCDYCGYIPALDGKVIEKSTICFHTKLVLCASDKHQTTIDSQHRLPELDKRGTRLMQVNHFATCDLCDHKGDPATFTFVPYPIKVWTCKGCLSSAGEVI
jgi:hypothetical protein